MKNINHENNLTAEKSNAAGDELIFSDNAEQTAQQVIPLAQPVYTNVAPQVSMNASKHRINPIFLVSICALAVLGIITLLYAASDRRAKSASRPATAEENKIEPVVVNVPSALKTEGAKIPASSENTVSGNLTSANSRTAAVENKKRENRESSDATGEPVSDSEDAASNNDERGETKAETDEEKLPPPPPLLNGAKKDKKGEKFLRDAERAQEKIKELKEIYDKTTDN